MENEIRKITNEWTNFLPSDPGITILEYLESFRKLQEQALKGIPETAAARLIMAAGYAPRRGMAAEVLVRRVQPEGRKIYIHKYQKFFIGSLCFETEKKAVLHPGELIAIYLEKNKKLLEIPELKSGNPLEAKPFGDRPKAGDRLYFLFDGLPAGISSNQCSLYAVTGPEALHPERNPRIDRIKPAFAEMKWECLTKEGYHKIECLDRTGGFLESGEIVLDFGDEKLCPGQMEGREGYIVRCTLTKADYDMAPSVIEIGGPMLKLRQKDTKAAIFTFHRKKKIVIPPVFGSEQMYLFIYVREADGRYYEYEQGISPEGRRFSLMEDEAGQRYLIFPEKKTDIKAVCLSPFVMLHRNLGTIRGYDGQEFNLGAFQNIMEDSLCLLVEGNTIEGEAVRIFLRPGVRTSTGLLFTYDRAKKVIRIVSCGGCEGAGVYIAGLSEYSGAKGNIQAGNYLITNSPEAPGRKELVFFNPAAGYGGRNDEHMEDANKRFKESFTIPEAAVTEEDYCRLALMTPGLCIYQAKATARGNQVTVAVTPWGTRNVPEVKKIYEKEVLNWLEQKRLLGIRLSVELLDSEPFEGEERHEYGEDEQLYH